MQLTSAELNVMMILWTAAPTPLSRDEICNSVVRTDDWKDSTFYVIMRSLKNKMAVQETSSKLGEPQKERRFVPLISCEEYYAQLMADSPFRIDFKKLHKAYLAKSH